MKKTTLQIQQLEGQDESFFGFQGSHPSLYRLGEGYPHSTWRDTGAIGQSIIHRQTKCAKLGSKGKEGSITLKSLREAANALDMDLVYALVPKDGSLEALIDRKTRELAVKIVSRTSHTMKLEDQENSKERIAKAIDERAEELKREMPKMLWD
ncbi:MAG: XRE family transcriptional regulator [Owenweeksia sp.]|nr:XRE family transcriptional regulator [Owenweeksia sp.]